ncbi:retrovirus-related pol polyprotein from transposon TNT 1-94 [Tanacetum coccineum]|uniref:Retrovirus-related pol polyprotein from transposon TNT 1-94 n=1 Tax=Tanacetum coccineum TaxID=301880 RepID=A0ABQ4Y9M4_9ASTR
MLLAGFELTKEDIESQLYDEFERFKMLPGENINEYYVRFHKLDRFVAAVKLNKGLKETNHEQLATLPQINNKLRTSSNTRNQATVQDGRIMVQNVQGRQNQNQNQRYLARGNGAAGNGGAQNRDGNTNASQGKPIKCYNYECDTFDSDVDDEPTAQSIFMANLSSAGLANLQAGPSNASTLSEVVRIVLWYLDSGCSKHMTGDRSRLRNFVKKFIGTVRFKNDHFGAIMGYEDYVIGDSVISRVYYEEGLGHNLFSVCQFCDSDLEVAFRKHTCFVRDLDGVDLIKGNCSMNLYTISVEDMMRSSPICLLSKASKNKSWLWHHRLNHLNFGTLNDLAYKDLVRGLPRLKIDKDHLCSACQLGKSRKSTHKPKTINTIMEVLHTLHMDLCGPLRVFMRTDNGTEFVNKDLTDYYESIGITHEKTVSRTPQQNGVVERRNRTLVEAARTMLIFSKAPLFLWAESVAIAYLSFICIFRALCYPTNDSEDLGKLKAKADIGFFVGYAPNRNGYRINNKQTRQIMETIHVTFDELTRQTTPVLSSPRPAPNLLTPGPISSGLVPNPAPAIPYVPLTTSELETLFQPMFDEYFKNLPAARLVPPTPAVQHSVTVNPFAMADPEPFVNVFAPEPSSKASSSGYPQGNSLQSMPCDASIILYCRKSNQKTSNQRLLKTAGFKQYKMKSMNLIDWTYGN